MSDAFDLPPALDLPSLLRAYEQHRQKMANLPQVLLRGRLVERVPSASNDVGVNDSVGDMNFTASYMYVLINNSGTPAWRRVALGSW